MHREGTGRLDGAAHNVQAQDAATAVPNKSVEHWPNNKRLATSSFVQRTEGPAESLPVQHSSKAATPDAASAGLQFAEAGGTTPSPQDAQRESLVGTPPAALLESCRRSFVDAAPRVSRDQTSFPDHSAPISQRGTNLARCSSPPEDAAEAAISGMQVGSLP